MPSVSVIMPCYNQGYHLNRVLEAYDCQSTQVPFEIIAIDDASQDNSFQILSSFRPKRYQLHAIHQDKNQGPAAARNLGIKIAQAPLIIFVGDDILPEKTFIQEHLDAHSRRPEPESAILGHVQWPKDLPINSLMNHIDGVGAEQFSFHYFKDGAEYDYRHFYTANISVKHALMDRLDHWFDTDFQFAAYEDVEFSYRLAKQGMKIFYHSQPVGYHYHYHNIWTFAERQVRAGLMALVLGRKHSVLRPMVMGKNWLPHLAWLGSMSVLRQVSSQTAAEIEQSILRLGSYFEWMPNPLTDGFYVKVLHYFYYKGIVQGFYKGTPLKVLAVDFYTLRSLRRIFNWIISESIGRKIAFPIALIPSPGFMQ